MATDGRQRPVVKENTASGEKTSLEQLSRAARPAKLIVSVPPNVSDNEDSYRDVRQNDPEKDG